MRQLIISAMLVLAASCAHADDAVLWKKVGAWTVAADTTLENNCFVATVYEGGAVLRLGFLPKGSSAPVYVMVGDVDWKSLEIGKDYDITVQLDRNAPWNATASAIDLNGVKSLSFTVSGMKFITEVMRKQGLKVTYEGKVIANLSLRGSRHALNELGLCQQAVEKWAAARQAPKDPFADPAPKTKDAKDPFAL